jgi:hypothetical protein
MSMKSMMGSACPHRHDVLRACTTSKRIRMNIPNKTFLSLHEVGAVIGRSSRSANRLITYNLLKAHKLRGRWVVTPENLAHFLKNLPSNF